MPPGTPLGAKRNLALDSARGELVAWFDDDDWQHPSRLRLLFERLRLPTVRHDTTHVGPCSGWFADIFGEAATEYRAPGFALFNGSLFVRKNIAGRRFVDQLRSSEDTTWLRALGQTRRSISVGPELPPLFFWLCHDENTSNPRTARSFERRLDELQELVGPEWGDTDEQLDALRMRLGAAAPPAVVSAPPALAQYTRTLGRTNAGTPRVWIVTPCMARLSFLRQTAPRVLSHPSVNYCLVDYSCPERCGDWLEARFPEAVGSGRCVVERVVGKTVFNKCTAHNAGARRAISEGADYLCFLDADSVVERGFFPWILEQLAPGRFLIAARRSDGFDMPSLTGLLVVSAAEFARTDGFDESFKGWGSEDIEMRLRLHVLNGLGFADVPLSLVRPLAHEDALRSSQYEEKDIHKSDARNYSLMLHKLHSWSREHPFDRKTGGRLFYRPPPITSTTSSESPPIHPHAPPPAAEPLEPFVVRDSKCTVAFDDWSPRSSGRPCRVRLYAACFEPEDEQRVDLPLRAQLVSSPTPYFEHDALIAVFANRRSEWATADFVGVLAPHRGAAAEPTWAALGRHLIATRCGYDAYGFGADDVHATAWRSLGRLETRALDIARHVLVKRLGAPESLLLRRVPLIRANRWIARKAVFERFVKDWLIPARAALEDANDRELQALLRPPPRGSSQSMPPESWLRRSPNGSICASYHPYVLERLAPFFFVHGGHRVRLL